MTSTIYTIHKIFLQAHFWFARHNIQYTRESFELLNDTLAGSEEINMNGGVQKCMETTKFNTKSGRTQD